MTCAECDRCRVRQLRYLFNTQRNLVKAGTSVRRNIRMKGGAI